MASESLKPQRALAVGRLYMLCFPLPICLKAIPLFPLAFLLCLTFAVFTTPLTLLPDCLYSSPAVFVSLPLIPPSQLWEFFPMFYHLPECYNFSGRSYLPFVPHHSDPVL